MPESKTIMYDSPEAASIQTVTGWVSSTGQFWGKDENMARYCGSTHRMCKVDPAHPAHRVNGYCNVCHAAKRLEHFQSFPKVEWDMATPITIFDSDIWFFDVDSLRDHMLDNEITVEGIQLVLCRPEYPSQIDPDEYYSNELPEDGDVGTELYEAFATLNAVIAKQPPLSWWADDKAVVLPPNFLAD